MDTWKKVVIWTIVILGIALAGRILSAKAEYVLLAPSDSKTRELSYVEKKRAVIAHNKRETLSVWQVLDTLIRCESQGRNVKHLDTNGYYSYGVLQIQKATWDEWSLESGITGDPMVRADAIKMGKWAVENGYLSRWSCAKIEGLI